MNRITMTLTVCMIAVLGAAPIAPAQQPLPDTTVPEQWKKAVHYFEHTTLIPGMITEHEEVIDHKGKIEQRTTTQSRLVPGKDGAVGLRLIRVEQDGKDVTDEFRKECEKDLKNEELSDNDPFTASRQDRVKVTCPGTEKLIRSNPCIACAFTLQTDTSHIRGMAWLNMENGLPVEVDIEMVDLPEELKDTGVKSIRQTNRYGSGEGSPWILQESELDMAVRTSGLFSFKGKVHTVITYDHYWDYGK